MFLMSRDALTFQLGYVVLAVYLCLVTLTYLISRIVRQRKAEAGFSGSTAPPIANVTVDFLTRLNVPLVVCTGDGEIIWKNRIWSGLLEGEDVIGKNLSSYCKLSVEELSEPVQNSDGVNCIISGKRFCVRTYRLSGHGTTHYIAVCIDKSNEDALNKLMSDETTLVAYVVLDNFDQHTQSAHGSYRAASGAADGLLREWAASVDGIIEEYERDKYIFFFAAKHLDTFMADKWSILDQIRGIKIGADDLPVTISVGTCNLPGNLIERAAGSASSLDMALQRGGDQAVVKLESGTEIYGGVTRSVQKRTKVRARIIANELTALMSKSSNVIIMGHRNADFDSFGASVGMAKLAVYCGLDVNIVVNSRDSAIAKPLEYARKMPGYEHVFIDAATAQDKIQPDTLLIIVDVNNPAEFESADIAANVATTVYIDHHRKTKEHDPAPVVTYIEPSASSTCELVCEILEQALPGGSLSKAQAELILAGIVLDTKKFTQNTGTKTFGASQYLRAEGADPTSVQDLFFSVELEDLARVAKFESNVIIYRSNIAISLNDRTDNTAADRVAAAKAADMLLTVEGVAASFAMCQIDDSIRISARSNGTINVQLILEKINGGGSYAAAAAQLEGQTLADALVMLKVAIDEYMEQTSA